MAWPRVYRDRADAIQDLGRIYNIDLNIGFFLLLPSHGLMIAAAFFGVVIWLIAAFLSPGMMASPPTPATTPPTQLPEASAV